MDTWIDLFDFSLNLFIYIYYFYFTSSSIYLSIFVCILIRINSLRVPFPLIHEKWLNMDGGMREEGIFSFQVDRNSIFASSVSHTTTASIHEIGSIFNTTTSKLTYVSAPIQCKYVMYLSS